MKKNIDLIIDGIAPEKVMYDTDNHSLIVLYPGQNEFKKGDILTSDRNNDTIMIFDEFSSDWKGTFTSICNVYNEDNIGWDASRFRLSTHSEQQILFDALKKEGKKWNAETIEIEDLDISDIVYDLETACEYLKIERPSHFILDEACERSNKFEAQMELQLICEAWNKFDGFVVDWDDDEREIYVPYFRLDNGNLKCIDTYYESVVMDANNNYSFKSEERALQFGNQFKDLFKTAMGL